MSYLTAARTGYERRIRSMRRILDVHTETDAGCACGERRPVWRKGAGWWQEHIAPLLAAA